MTRYKALIPMVVICLAVLPLLSMLACNRNDSISAPHKIEMPSIESIGQIHNEVLDGIYSALQRSADLSPAGSGALTAQQQILAVQSAANRELTRYGLPEMSLEQVETAIEKGRETARRIIARGSPDKLVYEALNHDRKAFEFYKRFMELRRTNSAEIAYKKVVRELGNPVPDSRLAVFFNVYLHSEAFWSDHYSTGPVLAGGYGYGDPQLGLRKFLRFVTVATTDALSGVLSGLGVGVIVGGVPGIVVGAVVGGVLAALSSYGADELLK